MHFEISQEKCEVRELFGMEELCFNAVPQSVSDPYGSINPAQSVTSPTSTTTRDGRTSAATPKTQATNSYSSAASFTPSPDIEVEGDLLGLTKSATYTRPHVRPCVVAHPEDTLASLLQNMLDTGTHVAVVCSEPDRVKEAWLNRTEVPATVHMIGCAFLEDILEAILGEEIIDERDVHKKYAERMRWARVREMVFSKARKEKNDLEQTATA